MTQNVNVSSNVVSAANTNNVPLRNEGEEGLVSRTRNQSIFRLFLNSIRRPLVNYRVRKEMLHHRSWKLAASNSFMYPGFRQHAAELTNQIISREQTFAEVADAIAKNA